MWFLPGFVDVRLKYVITGPQMPFRLFLVVVFFSHAEAYLSVHIRDDCMPRETFSFTVFPIYK